jgi:uncharacterized protein (DUF934 family)
VEDLLLSLLYAGGEACLEAVLDNMPDIAVFVPEALKGHGFSRAAVNRKRPGFSR